MKNLTQTNRVLLFITLFGAIQTSLQAQCPDPSLILVENRFNDCSGSFYDLSFTLTGAPTSVDISGSTYPFSGYAVTASGYTVQDCFDINLYDPIPCPFYFDPVCACNGVSYSNVDCANIAGYSAQSGSGYCTGNELVDFKILNVPSGTGPTITIKYKYGTLTCTKTYTFSAFSCCAPFTVTASVNGPVCSGASLNLQSSATNATSYKWAGPGGFTSTQQNPVRNNATSAYSGTYTVTVTNNAGCTGVKTVTATVLQAVVITSSITNSLTGTFIVSGGQPQNNGSNYSSVTMALQSNPAITATLSTAPFANNETVSFTAPQAGMYVVTAVDGNGCSTVKTVAVIQNSNSNNFCIEWQNTIGGSDYDFLRSIQQTSDGGYILGGYSYSNISGDKIENHLVAYDYWVIKLNNIGNIEWQNTISGNGEDYLSSIQQTLDGGYVIGGESYSDIGGDKTENSQGSWDYWVVKLNNLGNIQWQNTIGGNAWDGLSSIQQTSDGGYILGGVSNSGISGDKTVSSQGASDFWIVKLNNLGNIQWQKVIGGSQAEQFCSIQQTTDGGYILGGHTYSNISGDKTENNQGGIDCWIVKLNNLGNIQWQNTIGGNAHDNLTSIQQTSDGGYIIGGSSDSNISGDKTENSQGGDDYWVVKLSNLGNIQWQNTIGGSGADYLFSVQQTSDGGYILGGTSGSFISGDKTEDSLGVYDYWVVKLNNTGNIEWQNTIGGSDSDDLRSVQQTTDGGYILGGSSGSNIGGDKTENSQGVSDFWVVKLNACPPSLCAPVTTTADSGPGSLREAINCANSNPGPDTIRFNIPGAGPHNIKPLSELPHITDAGTVIDASTQPGWSLGKIVMDGSGLSNPACLTVQGGNGFELYGLVIKNTPANAGLELNDCSNFKIGKPGSGNAVYGNAGSAGQDQAQQVVLQNVTNGYFQSNIIGLTENYTAPGVGSNSTGLAVEGQNIQIGGSKSLNEGNVFGSTYYGTLLWDLANAFTPANINIWGNTYGTSPAGGNFVGNDGIEISGGYQGVQIGGSADHANIVKNYAEAGVYPYHQFATSQVSISQNQFSCNGAGIGLYFTDPMQSPVITTATTTTVSGTAPANAQIELYKADTTCLASCQGWDYIGAIQANAGGQWSMPVSLTNGTKITATATLQYTSTFSDCATVCLAPQAGFTSTISGNTLTFSNASTNATTYLWDFGDGMSSMLANPSHTYNSSGFYTVVLSAYNACGTNTATKVINTAPTADFSASPVAGCAPLIVQITNNSSTNALSYQWQFPGGVPASSNQANPVAVIYTSPGTYSITLQATNGQGSDSEIKTSLITVSGLPTASFSHLENGLSTTITNNSSGASSYLWNFGDGNFSTQANPSHTYSAAGIYEVCLTSSNNCGSTSTCQYDTLSSSGNCNPVSDSLELVKFFEATGGLNWTNPTNWKVQGKGIGEWYGITVGTGGCVTKIDLSNNNLLGILLDLNLPNLNSFYCNINHLSGNIPDFLNLPNLRFFGCYGNQIDGNIPNFSNLPNLSSFNCGDNQLSGSIPNFSNLPSLSEFYCYRNQITGHMPDFSGLPNLLTLLVGDNQISGPIPSFSNIPNLYTIDCSKNLFNDNLIKLPTSQFLRYAYFDNNLLTFEDILPFLIPFRNKYSDEFVYGFQGLVFHDTTLIINSGQNLNFSLDFDENIPTNVYRWSKGGVYQPAQDQTGNNNLIINNISTALAGVWEVEVTNPLASALTLHSRKITIQVIDCSAIAPPSVSGPSVLCAGSAQLAVPSNFAQYAWSNGQNSAAITVTQAGLYTVTVTDSNGCTGTDSQNVGTSVPPPTPSISGPPALCAGSATLQAGSFAQYAWSNGLSNAGITVTQSGVYTVTVTDSNGCTGTDSQNVGGNVPAPVPSISGPTALCAGSATLQTGSFAQYAWSNGLSNAGITVNQPGTYTVTVTDSNGCTGTDSQNVGASVPLPAPSISGPTALCAGSATLQTGSFAQYAWSNGLSNAGITVTQSGVYTVTVTDSNGCTGTDSQNVGGNVPAPVPSISSPTALCAGSATLQTGTFAQYAWSNGLTNASITVTQPDTYTVTVTDSNGCTGTDSQNVGASVPVPAPSISGPTALCAGSATLQTGNFSQYAWSNGQSSASITVTQSNTYTVTVTDSNGCTGTNSQNVGASVPLPAPSISGPTALCAGSATLQTGSFAQYAWSNGQSNAGITVTQPDTYTVTVTDSNGCTGTTSQTVANSSAPTAQLLATEFSGSPGDLILCIGDGATLIAGGGAQYQFWLNDVPQTPGFTTNNTLSIASVTSNLSVTVRIIDNNGCQDSTQIGDGAGREPIQLTLAPLPDLSAFSVQLLPGCPGEAVHILVQAPNLPDANHTVQYKINNGTLQMLFVPFVGGSGDLNLGLLSPQTNAVCQITQIGATTGCVSTPANATLPFNVPSAIQATLDTTICYTQSLVIGGQNYAQQGVYTIHLTTPNNCDSTLTLKLKTVTQYNRAETATICTGKSYDFYGTPLSQQGNYQHTIPGMFGCDTVVQLTLFEHPAVSSFLNKTICPGASFQLGDSTFTTQGFHQVTLTAVSGCDSVVNLNLNIAPISISFPQAEIRICKGEAATLIPVVQGCQNCQYQWNTGATQANLTVKPDASAEYKLSITGANGCSLNAGVQVAVQPIYHLESEMVLCPGDTIHAGNLNITKPDIYTLNLQSVYGCDSTVFLKVNTFDTSQLAAKSDTVIFPPNSVPTRTFPVTKNDFRARDYQIEIVPDLGPKHGTVKVLNKDELIYTLDNPDFFGIDSFQYELCPLLDCPTTCARAWVYMRAQSGTIEEAKKHIPNLITPNGDGFNDNFDPVQVLMDNGILIEASELFMINRWGEVIYHQIQGNGQVNIWDGKQEGRDLPQATYYYRLRVKSGEEYLLKGAVNLLR